MENDQKEKVILSSKLKEALDYFVKRYNLKPELEKDTRAVLYDVIDYAQMETYKDVAVIRRCPKCGQFPAIMYKRKKTPFADIFDGTEYNLTIGCSGDCTFPKITVYTVIATKLKGDEYAKRRVELDGIDYWNNQVLNYSLRQDSQENGGTVNIANDPAQEQ